MMVSIYYSLAVTQPLTCVKEPAQTLDIVREEQDSSTSNADETTDTNIIYRDINGQAAQAKKARKGRCLLSLGKS